MEAFLAKLFPSFRWCGAHGSIQNNNSNTKMKRYGVVGKVGLIIRTG